MVELRHPYISVARNALCSYGGSQMWSANENMRQCGCGVVAACDLLHYLRRFHSAAPEPDAPIPAEEYDRELLRLNRRYFPLIPHFGINGLFLTAGLNALFHREGLPYRARWLVSGSRLWDRVEALLRQDLPVILSVGPNFPLMWQKNRLPFYSRQPNGSFRKAAATCGHYVTATGIDGDWVRISSWGVCYYIKRAEYEQFVRQHSLYLFSNIVYLSKTR